MYQDSDGDCYPVLTGLFFTLSGLALMGFGLTCLVALVSPVGATIMVFGALCLTFGVFIMRTVCNFSVYSVEMSAEEEFEIQLEMTVVSSQSSARPIAKIQNWTMDV